MGNATDAFREGGYSLWQPKKEIAERRINYYVVINYLTRKRLSKDVVPGIIIPPYHYFTSISHKEKKGDRAIERKN